VRPGTALRSTPTVSFAQEYGLCPAEDEVETQRIIFTGTVFSARSAQISCRIFCNAPLIFVRGHPISLIILLESADRQALDLLAHTASISFTLEQRITVAGNQTWQNIIGTGDLTLRREHRMTRSTTGTMSASMHSRALEGILHVPLDTKPTSSFVTFVIEVRILLPCCYRCRLKLFQHSLVLQFSPPCFVPCGAKTLPKVTQNIQVVTHPTLSG